VSAPMPRRTRILSMGDEKMEKAKCFVIQPFGTKTNMNTGQTTDNDKIYEALKRLENELPSFPTIVSRADTGTVSKDDLHEHVITRLSQSDFCIADLTGQNPNVLYEAGYAKGRDLAIILIAQSASDIPTDLKKYLFVPYDPNKLDELPAGITKHFDRVRDDIMARKSQRIANVQYFATRNDADIRTRILRTRTRIDILQTNLVTIGTDYLQQIRESMRSNTKLNLRLLTLNPQSIFVNYRGAQVGFKDNIGLYRQELETNLQTVHFALREFGDRVAIRIYDDFPNQIAFYFDDDILVCIVNAIDRSRENATFLVQRSLEGANKTFVAHFDHLWKSNSTSYPLPQ